MKEEIKEYQKERDKTYNDSPNRVHPVIKIISKHCSNQANDVSDDIEKVILGISFDNLISERSAIDNQ